MLVSFSNPRRLGLGIGLATLALCSAAAAQPMTWYVDAAAPCPGDGSAAAPFCKIQPAIDGAFDGDVVLVAPGTYAEAIDFKGRDIRVASIAGAAATVINAAGKGASAVKFVSGEGPEAVLHGFRVSGGIGTVDPAVIFRVGGGVLARFSSPTVTHCQISGNTAGFGGGVHVKGGTLTMDGCLITGNSAALGGGVLSEVDAFLQASNCTISGNTAMISGSGMYHLGPVSVANSILWGNTGTGLASMVTPDFVFSDVQTLVPGTGNMMVNPVFAAGFRLTAGSPCLDAAHDWRVSADAADADSDGNAGELAPTDLDGAPRFVASSSSTPTCDVLVDMGAFELGDGPSVDMRLGDLDADGMVGDADLSILTASLGACMDTCCLADLNLDGMVDALDEAVLMANWNQPPPPPDDGGECEHMCHGKGHLKHDCRHECKHKCKGKGHLKHDHRHDHGGCCGH